MTTAAKNVESPSQEIQKITEEVQAAADATQSEAFRYEEWEDGSRIEIRCFPKPRTSGDEAPLPSAQVAGTIHKASSGKHYRCIAVPVNQKGSEEFVVVSDDNEGVLKEWAGMSKTRDILDARPPLTDDENSLAMEGIARLQNENDPATEPDDLPNDMAASVEKAYATVRVPVEYRWVALDEGDPRQATEPGKKPQYREIEPETVKL